MKDDKKSISPFFAFVLFPLLISAIWEKILSPLFDSAMEGILSISNSLMVYISDNIYAQISNGITDRFSSMVCSCLFGLLGAFTLLTISTSHELYKSYQSSFLSICKNDKPTMIETNIDESEKTFDSPEERAFYQFTKYRFLFFCAVSMAIFSHIFFFTFLIKQSYVSETSVKLTNNIEIVSPYVSELEYKQLKSDFHSMQSRSDYDNLVLRLETIGSENHLQLK